MVELFISRTETFSQGIRLFGGTEVFVTSREMGLSASSVLQKGVFEVKRIWLDEKKPRNILYCQPQVRDFEGELKGIRLENEP
jgi:hypothetical protein